MYYINREQLGERLRFIPFLQEACGQLAERWNGTDPLAILAQERVLHLAIETVTDVGSLLIDAFMMRDASSYEDIIEILTGEKVFGEEEGRFFQQLVKLRRPLVQDYARLERGGLDPLIAELPARLGSFGRDVEAFIEKEMKM
ncbi:DUF86 domain-containing protein [Paenibacillus aurantius]|uniref:DUF86 domain-containing protein n=1 Tax=Paenibacillus aurantius TaxID=2918900 RepID=A0AA96LAV5_9BACL|nr:HepT-like ribonuclease domain-containing protein [Paenibacillus aurantius]WJH34610.1 DUF86 domain-containing protein [Paenibacillus sp. CC-CFT747]WNQ09825.1 DUF86 domain-containing protein [Paenibacillus aurantius]